MSYASLTFAVNNGGSMTVRVNDPDTSLTAGAVNMACNRIIDGNIFDLGEGNSLVALRQARFIVTTRTVIF